MSHYKPYPAYKDSGVEWLGRVPEHWVTFKFFHALLAIKDGTHGTYERLSDGRPLLSAKNVGEGLLDISESESLVSFADYQSIVGNGFPARGDLLLTIVGTIGRAMVYDLDEPHAFQRSVCFLRLQKYHFSRFFYFQTQSKFFFEQLISKSKASAQAGVYMGDVSSSIVIAPSLCEQEAIAAHLDLETARIDALISKKTRFIELLREKRQALITHAVTKGLDPNDFKVPFPPFWQATWPATHGASWDRAPAWLQAWARSCAGAPWRSA